jgi:hypothetical protein
MMESLIKLPDYIQEILHYVTLDNIVKLDWSSNGMNIKMDRFRDGWMDRYRDMLCDETVGEMQTDRWIDVSRCLCIYITLCM